jgi:hypothetical protein
MKRRVTISSKVKEYSSAAVGKPSLNRAFELLFVDPKPSDLPMARVKAA